MKSFGAYHPPVPACEWCGALPIAWTIKDRHGHGYGVGCCRPCLPGAVVEAVASVGRVTVADLPVRVAA